MKTYLTILAISVLTLFSKAGKAQNWDEIFRQKKTQQKYLLQQIAGLKVYTDFAAKGYRIASSGLSVISSLKNGELGLHQGFFKGLVAVNPKIKTLARTAELIEMQLRISKGSGKTIRTLKQQNLFSSTELQYLEKTYQKLQADGQQILEQYVDQLTRGNLQASDARRLEAIGRLFSRMQQNHAFYQQFTGENLLLLKAREHQLRQISNTRNTYGIQPN